MAGYDAGPVAALRRIGFLLERGREETFKVADGETQHITVRSTRHGPILSDRRRDGIPMTRK